jgi:diguanylate cyclase (GGDEF)-like protein/PAS domain S-box-containing protein
MLRLFNGSSLWSKLLISFAGTLLLISVVSGEIYRWNETQRMREKINRESSKLIEVLSASLIDPIIAEDRPLLKSAIEEVALTARGLFEIEITNESGESLAQWSLREDHERPEQLAFTQDIVFEGERFGTLHMAWDTALHEEEIKRRILESYLTSAATLLVLTLMIGLLVRRIVIAPVGKINQRLLSLSRGDLISELQLDAAVEFERLADSVNALAHSLQLQQERESDLRLAAQVIDNASEGVVVTDPQGIIRSVNPAFTKITGYEPEEVTGKTPTFLKSDRHDAAFYEGMWATLRQTGVWQGELWNRRKDGRLYSQWLNISTINDEHGNAAHYVGIFIDTTKEHQAREHLRRLAYHDPLSGLPNRQLFNDQLDLSLLNAQREGRSVAVLFVDLDRFKDINDTLGHTFGDRLLPLVAARLKRCLRAEDTLARLGGDEFTVILHDLERPDDAHNVAKKILESFADPFKLDGRACYLSASIGISVSPDHGDNRESLLKHADVAMYRAKEEGRSRYCLYSSKMSERSLERLDLENDLRRAVEDRDLHIVFQPQVDTLSGKLVGVEALARWHHATQGWISPVVFIPMAEDIGLIGQIGEWVLRTACSQAQQWMAEGVGPVRVAVNISGRQLRDNGLLQVVREALEESGLDSRCLKLELTESVLMENAELAIATLDSIQQMGVQISIDDFGTGYSSLSYLKQFAISELKVDRSFIKGIPNDSDNEAIATAIIVMAHALGLTVTAEGVETEDQLAFLRKHGCDSLQGYLFGAPMPARELSRLLGAESRLAAGE